MASRRLKAAAPPERQTPPLNDKLLEDIFLRLSSADLARVSASCFAFRSIVADSHFLRRYRAVHPPLLLGYLLGRFHPAAARALATVAGAFFDFESLPYSPSSWRCHCSDVCEGRVLLECTRGGAGYPDIAVCDPLSRRYKVLPPIPDDLIASAQAQEHHNLFFNAFLVPSGHMEDTSFKVMASRIP